MEKEGFFSGYCRQNDGARTVMAAVEDGRLLEVDCLYERCPYADSCPVGEKLAHFIEESRATA